MALFPRVYRYRYELDFGIDILGDVNIAASFALAKVNNHRLTLSFKPSTVVDEQTLASFLPAGAITDPSQLPTSVPSYLIYVTPEIAFEGDVVARGFPMRLGEDLKLVFQVKHANRAPMIKSYKVPAGSYLSLSANQGSVSPKILQALEAKLAATKSKLESGDPALIGAVTKEDVLGDLFHIGTLGYWGQYMALAHVASLRQGVKHNVAAGFGSIGHEPNVNYFFGFPRAIAAGGIAVNVWVADVNADTDGDNTKRKNFQLQTGMLSSALEHGVPEQLFSNPTQQLQGVSAVKALQIAASQGQRIYHITPSNQAQALPNLHLDDLALDEISSALSAGKEVIAHTDRVSVPGWTGEGYILFDPVTGAAAYKITGGANGGFFLAVLGALMIFLGMFLIPVLAGLAPFLLISAGIHAFVIGVLQNIELWNWDSLVQILSFVCAVLGLLTLPAGMVALTVAAAWFQGIVGFILATVQIVQWLQTQYAYRMRQRPSNLYAGIDPVMNLRMV